MQDMLFSATKRNRAWVESRSILFLGERQSEGEGWLRQLGGDSGEKLVTKSCERFTWGGTGTDPRWAQRGPGTLFCPAGGESFHECNVQQSPEHKNTPGISLCCTQHQEHWWLNASCLTWKKKATYRQFVGEFRPNAAHFIFSCFYKKNPTTNKWRKHFNKSASTHFQCRCRCQRIP